MSSARVHAWARRIRRTAWLLACMVVLIGCVEREADGETVLFVYSWWMLPGVMLLGAALVIGGISRVIPVGDRLRIALPEVLAMARQSGVTVREF